MRPPERGLLAFALGLPSLGCAVLGALFFFLAWRDGPPFHFVTVGIIVELLSAYLGIRAAEIYRRS